MSDSMGRSLKREDHHHGGKPVGSGLIDDAKGYEECNCCLKCEFAPGKVHVRTTIATRIATCLRCC